jgi:hypothetical protein
VCPSFDRAEEQKSSCDKPIKPLASPMMHTSYLLPSLLFLNGISNAAASPSMSAEFGYWRNDAGKASYETAA